MAKKDIPDATAEMRVPAALNTVPGDPGLFGEPGISDEEELELVPKPEGLKRNK